jgi:tetratricopeptide (TPR) repeat protein
MKKRILGYLKSSTDLEEQYWLHKLLDELFQPDKGEPINGNQIDIIKLFNDSQKEKRRFRFNRKYLAVATVAILLGVSVVFYVNTSGTSNEKIFNSYYSPYKVDYEVIARTTINNSDFVRAVNLYDKGNYLGTINQLQKILITDTSKTSVYFLLGMSFMEIHNYKDAIKSLSYVLGRNDYYNEQIEWYLALCYLKTKQAKEAALFLNNLANKYNYQHNAIDILKKIN